MVLHAVPAEAAQQPDARRQFADLRHAVHGRAERSGPGIFGFDLAELRIGARDIGEQCRGRNAADCRSHTVQRPDHISRSPSDHAVMAVGELGVAHRAAKAIASRKPLAERRVDDRYRPRSAPACLARSGISAPICTLPASTTWPARTRADGVVMRLRTPGRIDLQRRRLLEDARARRLRRRRQARAHS